MTKYYSELDVESCLSTIHELKTKVKTGLDANEVLERSKERFLELLEWKIPAYMIVKHFHEHNINIPQNKIKAYITSIRPKSKQKTKRKTSKTLTQKIKPINNEINIVGE